MKGFWVRFAGNEFRWIARVLGTIIGLVALGESIESLGSMKELETSDYILRLGFLLVFAGCVVGWFKELAAAILILAGTAMLVVGAFNPGVVRLAIFPAVVGLLYLFHYLGTRTVKDVKIS